MKEIILTFDLEYWFESLSLQKYTNGLEKDSLREFTDRLLGLLKDNGATATFFVTGKILKQEPEIIRDISNQGHEIAIHSLDHKPLGQKTALQFNDELKFMSQAIEKLTGRKPKSHRAVNFSLNHETAWALEIMSDNEIKFDSSIFPFVPPGVITKIFKGISYGLKSQFFNPYRINFNKINTADNNSPIVEFPLSVFHGGVIRLPVTGGIYIRLIPWPIFKILLLYKLKTEPACLHFHPFDFAHKAPDIFLPKILKIVKYLNTKNTEKKLQYLLKNFRCLSIENYANENSIN